MTWSQLQNIKGFHKDINAFLEMLYAEKAISYFRMFWFVENSEKTALVFSITCMKHSSAEKNIAITDDTTENSTNADDKFENVVCFDYLKLFPPPPKFRSNVLDHLTYDEVARAIDDACLRMAKEIEMPQVLKTMMIKN